MKVFITLSGLLVLFLTAATPAYGQKIGPNPGEGKYRFCQRMYDTCMDGVFGSPGSQSYNVGQARCRAKWNDCRRTKTWTIGRSIDDSQLDEMDSSLSEDEVE